MVFGRTKRRILQQLQTNNELLRLLLDAAGSRLIISDDQVRQARITGSQALLRITSPGNTCHGTGFFISDDGYLLTARHVIKGANNTEEGNCDATIVGGARVTCRHVQDITGLDLKVDHPTPFVFLEPENAFVEDTSVAVIGFGLDDAAPGMVHVPNLTTGHISARRMTTGGLDAADQLCTANINMGVSGGPVMAIQSRRFVGVVFSLDRMYSQDQGQARFYVTTQHSDQWQVIQDHIDHDRRTVTDRAS